MGYNCLVVCNVQINDEYIVDTVFQKGINNVRAVMVLNSELR